MKINKNIQSRIYIVAIAIVILLITIGIFAYIQQEKIIKEKITITLDTVGKNTVRAMDEFMINTYDDLFLVSQSSTLQGSKQKAQFGLLKYIETFKTFDSLVYTDTSGNIIATSGDILLTHNKQNKTQAILSWFKKMVPSNKKLLPPLASRGDFIRYFVFHKKVKNSDNKTVGHLFGQMNSEKLASYSIPVKIGETGRVTLFNKDGVLIGHPVKSRYGYDMSHYPVMKAPIEKGVNNEGGFFVSGDGREKWGLTLLLENTQKKLGVKLGIIIDQTKDELYAHITYLRNSILIILLTLGVLLFYYFKRWSHKLFVESLLSNIAEGVYGVNKDGKCIWINPKALELIEFSKKEVLHKDQHALFHHHTPQGEVYKEYDCPIHKTIHDRKTRVVEEHFITKSGRFFPVSLTVAPTKNGSGAIVIFRDITKQKQAQQSLEVAKQKADQANKHKSEFLANMSHEIRTPTNAVIGLSEMLGEMELQKEQKNLVEKINGSSKLLLGIINDILDYSKIEAGKLSLEYKEFSLNHIVSQLWVMFEQTAKQKDIALIINEDKELPSLVIADELRLTQVLTNLLSNALKFTNKGGVTLSINLKEKLDENRALIAFSVEDTGIGMSKEQSDKLFQPFSQADSSTTRKYGGTGLGLVITKNIIKALGGDIKLQSEKNKGTTMSFTLKMDIKQWETKDQNTTTITQEISQNVPGGLNILLVEDNEINQLVATMMLEKLNIKAEVANNGQEGVDKYLANKDKYDLILMDLQMPILSGYEATVKIREIDKNTPIIALTAAAMIEDKQKVIEAGMNEHLSKPIDKKELFRVIEKYCNR